MPDLFMILDFDFRSRSRDRSKVVNVWSIVERKEELEIWLRAIQYGRADAAQVDLVNVAKGFRQTQKLQVVKSTERSEIKRPNFNEVFRASLTTCLLISVSIASTAYFWRIFEKVPKILFGNGPRNFKLLYHRNAALDFIISSPVIIHCQALPI
jgi:hypothetical protein